jgi:hypothetical protein
VKARADREESVEKFMVRLSWVAMLGLILSILSFIAMLVAKYATKFLFLFHCLLMVLFYFLLSVSDISVVR